MKWLKQFVLVFCVVSLVLPALSSAGGSRPVTFRDSNKWIKKWTKLDHDLVKATRKAARTFDVSYSWLMDCNGSEGGNVSRRTLAISITRSYGKGWNTQGSYAFGPWQYMLDSRPPYSSREWGTFGSYVHSAFSAAKRRGVAVPYRFKRPDSFVGQAITTAYMFSTGRSYHWEGAGC